MEQLLHTWIRLVCSWLGRSILGSMNPAIACWIDCVHTLLPLSMNSSSSSSINYFIHPFIFRSIHSLMNPFFESITEFIRWASNSIIDLHVCLWFCVGFSKGCRDRGSKGSEGCASSKSREQQFGRHRESWKSWFKRLGSNSATTGIVGWLAGWLEGLMDTMIIWYHHFTWSYSMITWYNHMIELYHMIIWSYDMIIWADRMTWSFDMIIWYGQKVGSYGMTICYDRT